MIIRLVKMQFKENHKTDFISLFYDKKDKIQNHEGCESVKLFNDIKDDSVFFTYSIWKSESDLNNYRNSEFFKETWTTTKSMFVDKAKAWSVKEAPLVGEPTFG